MLFGGYCKQLRRHVQDCLGNRYRAACSSYFP